MKSVIAVLAAAAALCVAAPGIAAPQSGGSQAAPDDKAAALANAVHRFVGTDEEVPPFTIVFGGIKQGSSIALGPAVGHNFDGGGFVQARAEYSIHRFALLQADYRTRPLWRGRAAASARIRWQDTPDLPIYRLGIDSPERRALYDERRTEWSGRIVAAPTPVTRFAAGAGLERYRVDAGHLATEADESLDAVPILPGLSTNSRFVHIFVAGGIDTRPSPGYSRGGSVIELGWHHYADVTTKRYSFSRFIPELSTRVPLPDGTSFIDLGARAWLSGRSSSTHMPFFLMPYLGGGDLLAAVPNYRFKDANAVEFSAGYSRTIHTYADVGGFIEAGTVAPEAGSLAAGDLQPVVGVSLVVHSDKDTFLRLRLGRGREHWGIAIAFSPRASAIF
jgi:hypothetical protein